MLDPAAKLRKDIQEPKSGARKTNGKLRWLVVGLAAIWFGVWFVSKVTQTSGFSRNTNSGDFLLRVQHLLDFDTELTHRSLHPFDFLGEKFVFQTSHNSSRI